VATTSATEGRQEGGKPSSEGGGFLRRRIARMRLFLRQVVAELKKVVRPTRTELITYTSVVLVFVLAVMTYVSVLDFGFGKLVLWLFGGGS
jgi:preprotein translocase subunit SecE